MSNVGRDFATKYRPRKWAEVVGQDHVVRVLRKRKDWKTLLFYGPPGTGKTTVARIVAMWVNCEGGEDDVCCKCTKCMAVLSGSAPDYREENVGDSRTIEAMRGIVDWLMYKPVFLAKKVLVLDEVHNLSIGAQNLLLKVLEEPPQNVVIVLCTTKLDGIIEPLRQRCQEFEFRSVSNDELMKLLVRVAKYEAWVLDLGDDVLKKVFMESGGSPRKFLTLLEKAGLGGEIVGDEEEKVKTVVDMVLGGDVMGIVRSIDEVVKELGARGVIPMVVSVVTKKMRKASSYAEVVKLYGVLNAMSLPTGLYAVREEDKVLYQLLSAALWVKNVEGGGR
jgi:DNA polymerase-3 subunit gamma/tau